MSVYLDRNTGAEEVAKQTELVMNNLKNLQNCALFTAGLNLAPPRSYSQTSDKENMARPRVQSNSPSRQQGRLPFSPVKKGNQPQLHEIRQEFSPISPVKCVAGREMFDNTVDTEPMVETGSQPVAPDIITSTSAKAYVSLARVDVAQLAMAIKNAAKQAAAALDNEEDEDDVFVKNLPMPGDFQPTPAIFSKRNTKVGATRKKVAEIEEPANDEKEVETEVDRVIKKPFKPGVSRPSEADMGFFPTTKAPSEVSEVTLNFKKPTSTVTKKGSGTKRKEAPEHSDALQAECRYLQSWMPRLRNKRLYDQQ